MGYFTLSRGLSVKLDSPSGLLTIGKLMIIRKLHETKNSVMTVSEFHSEAGEIH